MSSTLPLLSVLVVNDQKDMCLLWQRFIDMTPGLSCPEYATDGAMALEAIRRNAPHVVVMDVLMPVMRGDEALKIIREEFPDICIVMYSADIMLERELREAGADAFLGLPIAPAELTSTIRHAWRARHPS